MATTGKDIEPATGSSVPEASAPGSATHPEPTHSEQTKHSQEAEAKPPAAEQSGSAKPPVSPALVEQSDKIEESLNTDSNGSAVNNAAAPSHSTAKGPVATTADVVEESEEPSKSDLRTQAEDDNSVDTKRATKETIEIIQDQKAIDNTGRSTDVYWVPGFRAQFPWIGFVGFSCVIVAMAFATAILATSNGKRVIDWPTTKYPVAPNVLLNLVNQFSSLGLLTAITQGLAIAWWRKALRGGTIETLHRSHSYSQSFVAVLTSGKHFNTIALAVLMAKFTIIDSTLFQQATKTRTDYLPNYENRTVRAWIQEEWPSGVGGIPGTDGQTRSLSENFTNIITAYNTKIGNGKVHDTEVLFKGCPQGQTCVGSVDGLGFHFNCSTSVEDINYGEWRLQNLTRPPNGTDFKWPLWSVDFKTIWPTEQRQYASINMSMLYVNTTQGPNGTCPGTLTRRACEIMPAKVHYPINVLAATPQQAMNVTHLGFTNETKAYEFSKPMTDDQIDGIHFHEWTELNESSKDISTIGAITFSLNNLFQSSANLTFSNDWDLDIDGWLAQVEFDASSTDWIANQCAYTLDKPNRNRVDPFINVIRQINTFAFVSALYISGAPSVSLMHRDNTTDFPSSEFDTAVKGYVEVYRTDYGYLAGALVATLITVVCVLPVYWQFWTIGRKVTLDPFEIANALSAPLFDQTAKKNSDIEELIGEVGKRKLKYGLLDDGGGHLGMAEPDLVRKPKRRGTARKVTKQASLGAAVGAAVAAITLSKVAN